MSNVRIVLIWVLSFFFIQECIAGIDPVAWSVEPATGFPSVALGGTSSIIYTLSNRLPVTATINTSFVKSNDSFYIQDNCNNFPLFPSTSCTITIMYFPQVPGKAFIQLSYGYHNNRISLPAAAVTTTNVTPSTN
ncbi:MULTISPECIES: hypothetical protein [Legionella]|uniref:Thaumatin domain-containing protein n=1 Tax=Legionella drozanskii LLAP-1 TaxID=1212489 RepID=A0A0W0TE49_9GAMM|nr:MULTISPECIES: hypothetical protein [Legionella]KTC93814.1 Thaumatin domain-containing protein [Legionella drozanskii LLAP-1]PJE13789.1 MAG: hypothetical protein CK430_05885 [Legionella sp.]